ncbi:MAG: 1-acyl-sn-glycerol-3-phosphate acyltransferase [Chitinispirillaceae bacterium]|nr:1-acyl-sn-glycerol-3-phosphate acyltransferase [Chitinispirillaceae bacterium]
MQSHHQSIADISGGVDRFFKKVFTAVTVDGPSIDPIALQKHPHMIVSTHRSHVDYFLEGYLLFFRGFKNMRFAAGDNLTRLPYIGPRFRSFGAFSVARENPFDRTYVRNLCNRVIDMMEKREAVIVFPEGGRSYSGSMLEIKNGILGASVLLQARKPDDDVCLVPMAVSYECPPDLPYFSMLLAGKKFRKRTQPFFKRLLGNLLYFGADILAFGPFFCAQWTGRKYGEIYVDYEEPVRVRSIVDPAAHVSADDGSAGNEFFAHRVSMQKVSEFMAQRFVALYRLLPQHLLAEALRVGGPSITTDRAEAAIPGLLDSLRARARNLKSLEPYSPAEIVAQGKRQLLRLGAVRVNKDRITVRRMPIIMYCSAPLRDG